jgi:hypothetical protein
MTIGYRFARHLMAPFLDLGDSNRSCGPYRRKAPVGVSFVPGTTVYLLAMPGVPLASTTWGTAYHVVGVGMEGDLLVVNLA